MYDQQEKREKLLRKDPKPSDEQHYPNGNLRKWLFIRKRR